MPLSDADRQFLGREWRWLTAETPDVFTRYPGARSEDRLSPFQTVGGPAIVLPAIHELLDDDNQLYRIVVRGILVVNFKGMTPNLTLYFHRFGLLTGRTMIIERADRDYQREQTTLWLFG